MRELHAESNNNNNHAKEEVRNSEEVRVRRKKKDTNFLRVEHIHVTNTSHFIATDKNTILVFKSTNHTPGYFLPFNSKIRKNYYSIYTIFYVCLTWGT